MVEPFGNDKKVPDIQKRFEVYDEKNQVIKSLPPYGSYVHAHVKLERAIEGIMRKWVEKECEEYGILLGVRMACNGYVYNTRGDRAEKVDYKVLSRFPVVLFSPGPNRNPFYVPIWAIEE